MLALGVALGLTGPRSEGMSQNDRNGWVLRIAPSGVDRIQEALEAEALIIGWSAARGLLDAALTREQFRDVIYDSCYPEDESFYRAGAGAGHMWRFIREMGEGDLVVVPGGSKAFFVGEVAGPAWFDDDKVDDDAAYRRRVKWLNDKRPILRSIAQRKLISRMKTRGTTASATDLLGQIEKSLTAAADAARGKPTPTFGSDLRQGLVERTLAELRGGRIESFGFERLVEMLMSGLGAVSTWIVPRNLDKGIDLYAEFEIAGAFRQVVGIQAKHKDADPPVGADAVQQLIRGMESAEEPVGLGMVVTSGTFGPDATAAAAAYGDTVPIELVDGEQLANPDRRARLERSPGRTGRWLGRSDSVD